MILRRLAFASLLALAARSHAQTTAWSLQIGTDDTDWATAAAPDGAGGVYVGGTTLGDLSGPAIGSTDAWLVRRDPTGAELWRRQFGTVDPERLLAAASDGAGGTYVGGWTSGDFAGPSGGSSDAWVSRFDGAGVPLWSRQFGGAGGERLCAAAPDGAGGVFVAGEVGSDPWVARFDPSGTQLWFRSYARLGETYKINAAASDGLGGVYVVGALERAFGPGAGIQRMWVGRFGPNGVRRWERKIPTPSVHDAEALAAAPDGATGIFLGGWIEVGGTGFTSHGAWIGQVAPDGSLNWSQVLNSPDSDEVKAIAQGSTGGAHFCGTTHGPLAGPLVGSGPDIWTAAYAANGARSWIRQFGSSAADITGAATPDGTGGVIIAGSTMGSFPGPPAGGPFDDDAWIMRLAADSTVERYCSPAAPNSTMASAELDFGGSTAVVNNDLSLIASRLPTSSFAVFLVGPDQDFVPGYSGSQGTLCLGGGIERFLSVNQVSDSGSVGRTSISIDLLNLPRPTGAIPVAPGDTWGFQCWYRDSNPAPTSNLSDAIRLTFR